MFFNNLNSFALKIKENKYYCTEKSENCFVLRNFITWRPQVHTSASSILSLAWMQSWQHFPCECFVSVTQSLYTDQFLAYRQKKIYHNGHKYAQANPNLTVGLLSKIIDLMKQNCVQQVPPTSFINSFFKALLFFLVSFKWTFLSKAEHRSQRTGCF